MASLNQASIIGLLGADPKVTTTREGRKMATFSVATTDKGYTLSNGTVVPERTEWHNVVLWGKVAEVAERFLHKGSSVFVQGKMRTRTYEKDGQKRYITEVEGEVMQMLDRPSAPTPSAPMAPPPPSAVVTPMPNRQGDELPF